MLSIICHLINLFYISRCLGALTFRFFSAFIKNCFAVYKYPIKLPLSTVETYLGFNGSKVSVLYQLYKCPFHFCNFYIVSIILFKILKSMASSVSISFKS